MTLSDCHVHTKFSCDAEGEPLDFAARAREMGLSGMVFTEHLETRPGELCFGAFNERSALPAYRAAREHGVRVGYGLEVTYEPEGADTLAARLRELSPGFVIGSVHYVEGEIIDEWFPRADDLEPYLRLVPGCVSSGLFHALGHLDYFTKKTDRFRGYAVRYRPFLDEVIAALLDTRTLPEVNTSTLRRGIPVTMPGPDFLGLYRDAGGRSVYLGSDAHRPVDVGHSLAEAFEMVTGLGLAVAEPPEACFSF